MEKKRVVADPNVAKDQRAKLYVESLEFTDDYYGQTGVQEPVQNRPGAARAQDAREERKRSISQELDEKAQRKHNKQMEKEYADFVTACQKDAKEKVTIEDFEMLK